jgi:hypothetical protein
MNNAQRSITSEAGASGACEERSPAAELEGHGPTRDRSRPDARRRPAETGIGTALAGGYTTPTGYCRGAGDRGRKRAP